MPVAIQPRRSQLLCPVTALTFFHAPSTASLYLLAGTDNCLAVYEVPSGLLVCRMQIFRCQAILGVHCASDHCSSTSSSCPDDVVVWGARSVAHLPASVIEASILEAGGHHDRSLDYLEFQVSDWVYGGAISPRDATVGMLVTAHNEAIPLELCADGRRPVSAGCVSPTRPLLYSATLAWLSPTQVLVAAGTVFGEIQVWKCHWNRGGGGGRAEMLHVLTGHEGSVFGVAIFSPQIAVGGRKVRLLASCSDDRTIRAWDISDRRTVAAVGVGTGDDDAGLRERLRMVRETGFGGGYGGSSSDGTNKEREEENNVPADMTTDPDRQVALVMGHTSRIWSVRFLCSGPDTVLVYSFGEDATAQKWRLALRQEETGRGGVKEQARGCEDSIVGIFSHLETRSLHEGKHIWSSAVSQGATPAYVATGGADGKICLLHVGPDDDDGVSKDSDEPDDDRSVSVTLQDALGALRRRPGAETVVALEKKEDRHEKFRHFVFLGNRELLVVTMSGRLLRAMWEGGGDDSGSGSISSSSSSVRKNNSSRGLKWTEFATHPAIRAPLKTCSAVRRLHGRSAAVLGTTQGKLLILRKLDQEEEEEKEGDEIKDEQIEQVVEVADFGRSIRDLIVLDDREAHAKSPTTQPVVVELLVSMAGPISDPVLLAIDARRGKMLSAEIISCLDNRFLATSAAPVGNDLLVVGSRHGYLAVLRRTSVLGGDDGDGDGDGGDGGSKWRWQAVCEDRRTTDAVTAVVPLRGGPTGSLRFATTSRDGKYRIYGIDRHGIESHDKDKPELSSSSPTRLSLLHEGTSPLSANLEGAWVATTSSSSDSLLHHLILYGFRATNLVVYDVTAHALLTSVHCGGPHRSFAIARSKVETPAVPDDVAALSVSVAFNRAASLNLHRHVRPPHRAISPGTHGREARSTDWVTAEWGATYLATGSEDTTVRVWEYARRENADGSVATLRCIVVLRRHASGLQTVRWWKTPGGRLYLLSGGGLEEFFVWRVRRLGDVGIGIGVVCEAVFSDLSAGADLRIVDFDVGNCPAGGAGRGERNEDDDDDDHDNDADDADDAVYISMAFSDSTLKTYRYADGKAGFRLVARGAYTGACLTQIRHLHLGRGGATVAELLMASTDGTLTLWTTMAGGSDEETMTAADVPRGAAQKTRQAREYRLVKSVRVHQSSVKSLEMDRFGADVGKVAVNSAAKVKKAGEAVSVKDGRAVVGRTLVVTGGDDNALGITLLWVDDDDSLSSSSSSSAARSSPLRSSTSVVRNAHAASINGVVISTTPSSSTEIGTRRRVVTASNDQRLRAWDVGWSASSSVSVGLVAEAGSGVADAGDATVLPDGSVVVVGVGLEVWTGLV